MTGYLVQYRSNLIAWKCKIQTSVTKSATHAVFVICNAAPTLLFFTRVIKEIFRLQSFPVCIFKDNTSFVLIREKTLSRDELKYISKKLLA